MSESRELSQLRRKIDALEEVALDVFDNVVGHPDYSPDEHRDVAVSDGCVAGLAIALFSVEPVSVQHEDVKKCAGGCGGRVYGGYEFCVGCTEGVKILNRNAIRLQREEKEKYRAIVEEFMEVTDDDPSDYTLDLRQRARVLLREQS